MLELLGVRHRATPLSRWFLCIDEVGYSLMGPAMMYQVIAVIVATTLSLSIFHRNLVALDHS